MLDEPEDEADVHKQEFGAVKVTVLDPRPQFVPSGRFCPFLGPYCSVTLLHYACLPLQKACCFRPGGQLVILGSSTSPRSLTNSCSRVAVLRFSRSPEKRLCVTVSAKEYASQRLFGKRHKRSQEMLFTVQGRRQRPQWKSSMNARRLKA